MSLPEGRDVGFASGRVSGVEGRNILGVRLPEDEARARFAAGPVVRLGTADGQGRPHVVVVTFVVDGDMVYTAVDQKPKSGRLLSSSGTSRGHVKRLKGQSKMRTTRSPIEIPGNGRFSSGAAYRNRTDDLRITSASL